MHKIRLVNFSDNHGGYIRSEMKSSNSFLIPVTISKNEHDGDQKDEDIPHGIDNSISAVARMLPFSFTFAVSDTQPVD